VIAAALSFLLAAAPGAQTVPKPVSQDPPSTQPTPPITKPQGQKPPATNPGTAKPAVDKPVTAKPTKGNTAKNIATRQQPAKATSGPGSKPAKQEPPVPQRKFHRLTTPDGSLFFLIQDPTVAHIHWAIASWADGRDDPPGLPGLALATAQASLAGTWSTGSRNPQTEREALIKLEEAWQQQLAKPGDPKAAANVISLDKEAAKLSDPRMFERLLAAAPAFQPEVLDRGPLAVFILSTTEPAIETVAKLLLERREEQALRGLSRAWMPTVLAQAQAHAMHPRHRLHTEVLALLMPSSPAIAQLEAPPFTAPDRDQAQATWRASQHPANTVHVLIGNFNVTLIKKTLKLVFSKTKLIAPTRREIPPSTLRGQRRSIVPGITSGGGAIAWVLPPITDPTALELARRWLMDERGPLQRALGKKRPNLTIDCRAPWPTTSSGQSLLLLDVQDPNGKPGLIDEVIAICNTIADKPFSQGQFYPNYLQLLRDWNQTSDSPRAIAAILAQRALVWPSVKLDRLALRHRKGDAVHPILKAVFATHPAIAEAK
jgi:hypothetical protein